MNPREFGFLLLTGKLGAPDRRPLTPAQLRLLAQRASLLSSAQQDGILDSDHLTSIGLNADLSRKIIGLLEDEPQLKAYLTLGKKHDCFPLVRGGKAYPPLLRKRMGLDAPGCLWAKGDIGILNMPKISLVGSRELWSKNRQFAEEAGRQAARQGYALVSGNAQGADTAAQDACLKAGGSVISVVADSIVDRRIKENMLYLSEDDFDAPFSVQRALHRNYIIHCLGQIVFVAQCRLKKGGTWDGSTTNLLKGWSSVYCMNDGSEGIAELERLGAVPIEISELSDFTALAPRQLSLF